MNFKFFHASAIVLMLGLVALVTVDLTSGPTEKVLADRVVLIPALNQKLTPNDKSALHVGLNFLQSQNQYANTEINVAHKPAAPSSEGLPTSAKSMEQLIDWHNKKLTKEALANPFFGEAQLKTQ